MTSTPAPNPVIVKAVEHLDYRVTVGDVASQAGLDVNLAQQGLLALASQADAHLQVADSGEVVYLFPRNFRNILRDKNFRLRLKEWWEKVWRVLFYLIRISFGLVLVLLIVLAIVAIIALTIAANSSRDDNDSGGSIGGDGYYSPGFWFSPDFYWIFLPDYDRRRPRDRETSQLNFLEAVFSFLFGDGNPNGDLEERRWKAIAAIIRNNRGAVIAEQIAPYLDDVGAGFDNEYEQYMLPVLTRFDGRPEVSPEGQLVYQFPSLQTTVASQRTRSLPAFLRESLYQFSQASSGQITLAAGLGIVLLILAVFLNGMVAGGVAVAGAAIGLIRAIAVLSLGYSAAYLTIPVIRYFWIQGRNKRIRDRNQLRESRVARLNQADPAIQQKLMYAQQFAAETVIQDSDLVYTTETDLTEQESLRSAQIDAEWQRRLEGK
jgi:hypothetical protein